MREKFDSTRRRGRARAAALRVPPSFCAFINIRPCAFPALGSPRSAQKTRTEAPRDVPSRPPQRRKTGTRCLDRRRGQRGGAPACFFLQAIKSSSSLTDNDHRLFRGALGAALDRGGDVSNDNGLFDGGHSAGLKSALVARAGGTGESEGFTRKNLMGSQFISRVRMPPCSHFAAERREKEEKTTHSKETAPCWSPAFSCSF